MRIAPMRARALPLPTERRDGACLARPALRASATSQRYESESQTIGCRMAVCRSPEPVRPMWSVPEEAGPFPGRGAGFAFGVGGPT